MGSCLMQLKNTPEVRSTCGLTRAMVASRAFNLMLMLTYVSRLFGFQHIKKGVFFPSQQTSQLEKCLFKQLLSILSLKALFIMKSLVFISHKASAHKQPWLVRRNDSLIRGIHFMRGEYSHLTANFQGYAQLVVHTLSAPPAKKIKKNLENKYILTEIQLGQMDTASRCILNKLFLQQKNNFDIKTARKPPKKATDCQNVFYAELI